MMQLLSIGALDKVVSYGDGEEKSVQFHLNKKLYTTWKKNNLQVFVLLQLKSKSNSSTLIIYNAYKL